MYTFLFSLAGVAIAGWALLILLPGWSVTRRLAEWALFPAFLCAVYVIGLVPLLANTGLGVIGDFGTAEGVIGLLAQPDIALIAWIHILAFDHLVGVYIYRDNMRHRVVPLPLQSLILFLTLMFGPAGFLTYYLLRIARRGRFTEAEPAAGALGRTSSGAAPTVAEVPHPPGPLPLALVRAAFAMWRREPVVATAGALGVLLGALLALAALVRGNAVTPEGNLLETASFDGAVGIFLLTLAALAPLAAFTRRGRRVWTGSLAIVALYSYGIETVQAMRGLDPRFSAVAGPVDQALGGVFFLAAQGVFLCFLVLAWKYFRPATGHLPHALRLSVRYGAAAALLAFIIGDVMSAISGRSFGEAGNLLPLHAAGFHGMQAVPLVALLWVWNGAANDAAVRWTHVAGVAWLTACAAIAFQTFSGRAILAPSAWTALAVAALLVWFGVLARAATSQRTASREGRGALASSATPR